MEVLKRKAFLFYSCKMSGILFHFLKTYTIPTFTKLLQMCYLCATLCANYPVVRPFPPAKSALSFKSSAHINPHCLFFWGDTDLRGNRGNRVLHSKCKIKGHNFKMSWSIKPVVAVGCVYIPCMVPLGIQSEPCLCMFSHTQSGGCDEILPYTHKHTWKPLVKK